MQTMMDADRLPGASLPLLGSYVGRVGRLVQERMDRHPEGTLGLREAARRCDMTHEALRKILAGRTTKPSAATLVKLSTGLGIPMAQLREAAAEDAGYQYETATVEAGGFEYTVASIDELTPEQLLEVIELARQRIADIEDSGPDAGEKP